MALSLGSVPVSATISERDHFVHSSYDDVRWDCGYPMEVKGETRHNFRVREDRKVDGLVYVSDNYAFKETWTAADGRSFGLSANSVTKDVQAVPLGGSNYRFTFKQPGQAFDHPGFVRTHRRQGPREHHVRLHLRPR